MDAYMKPVQNPLALGYGPGISGPTTPCENYFSVAARIEKSNRERAWKDGDKTSPWPQFDAVLVTTPSGRVSGCNDTVAIFVNQNYPYNYGLLEAERLAKLFILAPRMAAFLEWAAGIQPKIFDQLPLEVRTEWQELLKEIPR